MIRPCDERSARCRALRSAALLGSMSLWMASALAAPRLTPPPSLASIPPRPAAPASYAAQVVAAMPRYVPEARVSGVIRIWGHGNPKLPWMRNLIALWERGFRRFQPGARLQYRMYGTSSGVPALATGVGDVAILGEELLMQEVRAFERVKGYPPTAVQIMTGSVGVRNFDYAQQFFVHAGNPLTHATLAQLAAIFGAHGARGEPHIGTWGGLGLSGRWAREPVRPYGWALDDSFAVYLDGALLGGGHEWSCALRQFRHIHMPDGSIYDHGQQILDALARDPEGIAVSNIRYAGPNVRPLALGLNADGPFYQATERTLIEQLYPLARTLPAIIDVPPGGTLDPLIREFLRYLLSREGQQAVNEDGRYLPLSARMLSAQLRMLPPPAPNAVPPRMMVGASPDRLRIWGPPAMAAVVRRWAAGFRTLHPEISIEPRLMGSDTAIAGLYSGRADIALLGRRDDVTDDNGFSRPKGYLFTRLQLMSGSLESEGRSPALAVLVSRDNPVSRLTLEQLARIASCPCAAKAPATLRWSDLGARGDWAAKPVHLYLMDITSGTGQFFLRRVTAGSAALAWSRVSEMPGRPRIDDQGQSAAALAAAALRKDPYGIAVSTVRYADAQLKVVAIAATDSGPYVLPTADSIVRREYPLARNTYAFIDRPPGHPIAPAVSAFLRYALSRAGQAAVAGTGGYLPLADSKRRRELAAMGEKSR